MKLPETGIEPVRVLPRRILSPVRLPIPPLGLIFNLRCFSRLINIPKQKQFVNNFFYFFQKSFYLPKNRWKLRLFFLSDRILERKKKEKDDDDIMDDIAAKVLNIE